MGVSMSASLTASVSSVPLSPERWGSIGSLLPDCQSKFLQLLLRGPGYLSHHVVSVGEKHEGDKPHLSTFSRFREKRSNGRPGTSDGTVSVKTKDEKFALKDVDKGAETEKEDEKQTAKEKAKAKEKRDRTTSLSPGKERDQQVLRKRTSSAAEIPTRSTLAASKSASGAPSLKAGQSILEQIGTPDHNGWLRKKGDRYNSWKQRYFVLKGPHLYWLRSESTSVCVNAAYVRHTVTDIDILGLRRRRRSRAI